MKNRRTFVAVSFGPANAEVSQVETLSYVSYAEDEIEREGTIRFSPIGKNAPGELFETAFAKIGALFNASTLNPPKVPVIVWNDRSRFVFDTLIHESEINYMAYPPRYFILQRYVSRKLWNTSKLYSVQEIAKKLSLTVGPCEEPDAEHIAAIMRRLEDVSEFPPVIAKAFCAICESVVEDGVIEKKEAIELSSFLKLISNRYPEFKDLENALDAAVRGDLLVNGAGTPESDRLIQVIKGMIVYFKNFVPDENNGENRSEVVAI